MHKGVQAAMWCKASRKDHPQSKKPNKQAKREKRNDFCGGKSLNEDFMNLCQSTISPKLWNQSDTTQQHDCELCCRYAFEGHRMLAKKNRTQLSGFFSVCWVLSVPIPGQPQGNLKNGLERTLHQLKPQNQDNPRRNHLFLSCHIPNRSHTRPRRSNSNKKITEFGSKRNIDSEWSWILQK